MNDEPLAESGCARLLVDAEEGSELAPEDLDYRPGKVEIQDLSVDGHEEPISWTWEFDTFLDGRAAFGLWCECGPFLFFDHEKAVPLSVVQGGKPAIGTYLYIIHRSQAKVANILDVSEQTMSNYLCQLRWVQE